MKGLSLSTMPATHITAEAALPTEDLAALLPPGWPLDTPLARVRTCGPLTVEVVTDLQPGPDGQRHAVYGPPTARLFSIRGMGTALVLLSLLTSQLGCLASKDFLMQTLAHLRAPDLLSEEDEQDEDEPLKRLDNVVSLLRKLLCPPVLLSFPGANLLRKRLVRLVRATPESGSGYRLASFPLLWLDVEAMETYAARARRLEEHGEDGLEDWQAVYHIGMRGPFLGHEPYSAWADWRRARVAELLWQSVSVQGQRALRWEGGPSGLEAAARLLLDFWQAHVTNEDAFRALAEVLGRQDRLQQAEECYTRLCTALEREGRLPQPRTQETMTALRLAWERRTSQQRLPMVVSSLAGSLASESEATSDLLVPETRHLIGREAWLRGICQMVQGFPSKKLLIMQGPIGIGKSSELARLAERFQQAAARVIWLRLPVADRSGSPEAALDMVLGTVLSQCGVAPFPAEAPRERLMTALLAHLRQESHPTVILLDNAECLLEENGAFAPCWQAFLTQWVRSRHPGSILLATNEWRGWPGRESLFVSETMVPPLTADESVYLLQRQGLEGLPVEQLQAVAERMSGIPLLLEWTTRLLADPLLLNDWRGFDEREAILYTDVTQERRTRRLQRLLDDPALLGEHLASRLTPLLQRIMDKQLSPEARRVLERLSVATIPLGKPALQVLCPRPALLKELRDASLLAAYTNRVQALPMVAESVRQQLTPEQRQEAEDLVIQAYTQWRKQGIEDDQEKAAVIAELITFDLNNNRLLAAAERLLQTKWLLARFGHILRIAHLTEQILERLSSLTFEQECGSILLRHFLAPVLGQKCTATMRAQAYQPLYEALLQQRIHFHETTEFYIVQQLVLSLRIALRFSEAEHMLAQTFARHPDLEQIDLHQFASLLAKKATLQGEWSDYADEQKERELARTLREQSIALHRQCISLWKRVEKENPPEKRSNCKYNQAQYLNNLAYYLRHQGLLEEALEAVEECIALRNMGYGQPGTLATAYGEKAQILMALGRFREALHFDELAVEDIQQAASQSGNSKLQEEVWVYLAERGQLYLRLGKLKEADALFEQASTNMSDDRRSYHTLAENGRAEIRQWRQTSASEQFDWRWAARYRDIVHYDAFYWLTPAAFSSAEQKEWEQLQTPARTTEQQPALEALVTRSRNREILAALSEGREPHLHYPRLSLPEVTHKIEALRSLAEEIAREEPNAIVRRLYLEVIGEHLSFLQMIQATHNGDVEAFQHFNHAMHPEPTIEEMERTLFQVARLIALGKQRADLVEISEQVEHFLQRIHAPLPEVASPIPATAHPSAPAASPRMVSAQTVQRFFDAVIRDYGFDGWQTVIDAAAPGLYIEQLTQRVTLPDRPLSTERVRELLSHEIECHVFRAAAGAKSRLDLLGTGTAYFMATEEGLTLYYDRQTATVRGKVEDEFVGGSYIGTLATGLASGVETPPLTFSRLYQFFERFYLLQRLVTGIEKDIQKARSNAASMARQRCVRTFRGVPDLTAAGVAYTHDALYHRGLSLVKEAIQKDPKVLTRLMVGVVGLQQLDDLAELGIIEPPIQSRWLAHDPELDAYILSFEAEGGEAEPKHYPAEQKE